VTIPKDVKKETKVKFGEITQMEESETEGGDSESYDPDLAGKRYSKTTNRRNTGVPLVKLPAEEDSDDETTNQNSKSTIKTETLSNTDYESVSHGGHNEPQAEFKIDFLILRR